MIACYLGLYEEGEVEHINGPTHPFSPQLIYTWLAIKRLERSECGNFCGDSLRVYRSVHAAYPNILTTNYPHTTDKSVTDLSQTYTEQICNMSVTDLYLKLPQSYYKYVTYLVHVCYR